LAFFGISKDSLDPNQIHLLFAPLMTAYGLAFISILWSRLDLVAATPALRNVHHIIIIIICALPLVLALPPKVRVGMQVKDRGGIPQWPPYYAPALNSATSGLKSWVTDKQIIVSDQPWAVAWYADRISIWLPPTREGFAKLESVAADLQTPVAGILISPVSHGSDNMTKVAKSYLDFAPMVLDGNVLLATYPPGIPIYENAPRIQEIAKRYPHRKPLVGLEMIYYSDRLIASEASE
jgi:hypothetical protein